MLRADDRDPEGLPTSGAQMKDETFEKDAKAASPTPPPPLGGIQLTGVSEPDGDEELRKLLAPDITTLPDTPLSSVDSNFQVYFAPDFIKPGHDQYVYRHPNGLCVIGMAPMHVAFKDEGGIIGVDFNVGKSDRSQNKVTGKRKRNAQHFESNTALCKVSTNKDTYIVRCCVKGSLLEVNDKLIKQPGLLNSSADREGYIAIIMPKALDWVKIKGTLLSLEEYKKLREPSRMLKTI